MELGYANPNPREVLRGLFVPQLKGNGATGLAISLLGAMVMPYVSMSIYESKIEIQHSFHFSFLSLFIFSCTCCRHNLFLHSALVLSRKIPRSVRGIKVILHSLWASCT